jgi:hypothetical protein
MSNSRNPAKKATQQAQAQATATYGGGTLAAAAGGRAILVLIFVAHVRRLLLARLKN